MFEIMWYIQNSMKTIKEFPEEKEWVKTRLAKIKEDELTMKSKRIK